MQLHVNSFIRKCCIHIQTVQTQSLILTEEADFLFLLSQILLLLQQLHEWSVKSLSDPFTCLETTEMHCTYRPCS